MAQPRKDPEISLNVLMMSLDRWVDAQGHAGAGRGTATVGDKHRDFNTLEDWLGRYLPRGLSLDAAGLGTCFQPAFTQRAGRPDRAGVKGIMDPPDGVLPLLPGLNADKYAAELQAAMAG